MRTLPATAVVIALALSSCGSGDSGELTSDTSTPAAEGDTTNEPEQVDPYEVYLANAPGDAPDLSRDAAQLRAMLGCGTSWAPGTVDAVLQEAYASLVEEWRAQGVCDAE